MEFLLTLPQPNPIKQGRLKQMSKSSRTSGKRIRRTILPCDLGKYMKEGTSPNSTTIRWWAHGRAAGKCQGAQPLWPQSSALGVNATDAFPLGAISTSSPRFRAFQSLPVVSGDRSMVSPVASAKYLPGGIVGLDHAPAWSVLPVFSAVANSASLDAVAGRI